MLIEAIVAAMNDMASTAMLVEPSCSSAPTRMMPEIALVWAIRGVCNECATPLMAQTNAISGIILVGAVLQLGSTDPAVLVMSFIAAAIASINIFGGFLVSYRMLSMFKKGA